MTQHSPCRVSVQSEAARHTPALKSCLLGAAMSFAVATGFSASWAHACPGTPSDSMRSPDGAPMNQTTSEPTLDGGGIAQPPAPIMPVPCAPPPWITGGPAPGSNFAPMQYGAAPDGSYANIPPGFYTPAPAVSSAGPKPYVPSPGVAPSANQSNPAASEQASPAPVNYASNPSLDPDAAAPPTYSRGPQPYAPSPGVVTPQASAPSQQDYAYIPPPAPALPVAPYPPAYRTAIAPKLPPFLAVLSSADAERYARAYAAGDARLFASADALLAEVDDPVLLGSVLARRYTSKSTYNPRYAELYAWLVSYSDNAQADAIYAAALPKMTPDAGPPPRPEAPKPRSFAVAGLPSQPFSPRPTAPDSKARIDAAEQAFYAAQPEQALSIASGEIGQALDGDARFISGLAAFRLQRFGEAAQHLDAAARTPYFAPGEIAAAAYWSGRAHLAAGQTQESIAAFKLAAAQPLTFYGALADRQLGREPSYRPPAVAQLDPANAADLFARYPAAKRAAALAQLGHLNDAEAEIKALQRRVDPSEDIRLLELAQALGLASAATRIAEMGSAELAAGLYPDPPYAPTDGYRVNKALLFGIARQESRLNPEAVSASNARGLMQLLPSTAAWIGNNPQYKSSPDLLFDPLTNLKLGQLYVEHLFDEVSPDLVRVLAAYNMGPGALKRWLASVGDFTDPLLLIESIPKDETRNYVKRVLANMWLYESRYGAPSPTLEAMAAGRAPIYVGTSRIY